MTRSKTRPKPSPLVFVGALAVAGVGTLLWCAWLILIAPLPNGAAAAAWTLWLLSVAALVTLVAYLREMSRHGKFADRASWKPLPGLVLLWLAGLTALMAFPFVLPERTGGPTGSEATSEVGQPAPEATNAGPVGTTRSLPSSVSRSSRTSSPSSAEKASSSSATSSSSTSRSTPQATTTTAPRPAPTSVTSTGAPSPTSSTSSSSSTTSPLVDITLPRGSGRPTDKPPPPGHG